MQTRRKSFQELLLINASLLFQSAVSMLILLNSIPGMSERESDVSRAHYVMLSMFSYVVSGFIGDRIASTRWSVVTGSLLQLSGIFLVLFHTALYPALCCITIGSALQFTSLMSATGRIYADHPQKLDAAFSLNYLATSVGSFLLASLFTFSGPGNPALLIFPAICSILSAVPCFFVSEKKAATISHRTETNPHRRLLIITGVILFGMFFWIFLRFSLPHIMQQVFSERSSFRFGSVKGMTLGNIITLQFTAPLYTAAVVSLLGAIAWFYVKVNSFIKLAAGAIIAGAGTIFLIALLSNQRIEYWMILLFLVLMGIGQAVIHTIIPSIIAAYAPPRYTGTFIGISWLFSGLVANFIVNNTGSVINIRTSPVALWGIGMLIIGIVVLLLVLTKRNNSETPIDSEA